MYAARRTGLKKEMFGYVRGGYARILERFAECWPRNGVRIRLGSRCERVAVGGRRPRVELARRPRGIVRPRGASPLPAPLAARVCPGSDRATSASGSRVNYQGIVCASLLLKQAAGRLLRHEHHRPWVPFTAVIEMSALVDRAEFGGQCLVYLPKYVPPGRPALRADRRRDRASVSLARPGADVPALPPRRRAGLPGLAGAARPRDLDAELLGAIAADGDVVAGRATW